MEERTIYQSMYCKMAHAAEEAIRLLIAAQQECEDMFLENADMEIKEDLDALGQAEALRKRLMTFGDAARFLDAKGLEAFYGLLEAALQTAQQIASPGVFAPEA